MRRRCTSRRAGSTGSRPTLSSSHSGSAMSLRASGVISRRCREKRGRLRSHASEQNSVTGYARFENTIRRTCSFTTGVVLIPSRGSLDRQAAENQGRPFGELTPLQQAASEPPGSTFSITRACARHGQAHWHKRGLISRLLHVGDPACRYVGFGRHRVRRGTDRRP